MKSEVEFDDDDVEDDDGGDVGEDEKAVVGSDEGEGKQESATLDSDERNCPKHDSQWRIQLLQNMKINQN